MTWATVASLDDDENGRGREFAGCLGQYIAAYMTSRQM